MSAVVCFDGVVVGGLPPLAAAPCRPPCDDEDCFGCAISECPHGEPLHRHHDGCPACTEAA